MQYSQQRDDVGACLSRFLRWCSESREQAGALFFTSSIFTLTIEYSNNFRKWEETVCAYASSLNLLYYLHFSVFRRIQEAVTPATKKSVAHFDATNHGAAFNKS